MNEGSSICVQRYRFVFSLQTKDKVVAFKEGEAYIHEWLTRYTSQIVGPEER